MGETERDANAVYSRGGETGRPSKLFANATANELAEVDDREPRRLPD